MRICKDLPTCVTISDDDIEIILCIDHSPWPRCLIDIDTGLKDVPCILWLNDSKSTNLHSTEAAVRSQTRPVILIAGGKDKGLDYSALNPMLEQKARLCIVFGQIAAQLEQTFTPACRTLRCQTVEEAVTLAAQNAAKGDVVLFSPGTSSFDQFTGYVQRGNCYREAVRRTLHL